MAYDTEKITLHLLTYWFIRWTCSLISIRKIAGIVISPNSMDPSSLDSMANKLVKKIMKGCESHSLGSATVAIYDTAWVAMVSKVTDSKVQWVFPECFQFLLDSQLPDGGWESHGSNDNRILNTMAALLAMIKHKNAHNSNRNEDFFGLETRIEKARLSLEESLQHWDVESAVHVGFEMLVPALLRMLATEKMSFIFPGQQSLEVLNEEKLKKIKPETLYTSTTTMLHSLEAFIGRINFDKIGHQKKFGSMMASPASTAAYLMHCSTWDTEAESYIRKVILEGEGKGSGGLPSVFPAPIFELTWVRRSTSLKETLYQKLTTDPGSVHSSSEWILHQNPGQRKLRSRCILSRRASSESARAAWLRYDPLRLPLYMKLTGQMQPLQFLPMQTILPKLFLHSTCWKKLLLRMNWFNISGRSKAIFGHTLESGTPASAQIAMF